jgi:hypothetical protein
MTLWVPLRARRASDPKYPAEPAVDVLHERFRQVACRFLKVSLLSVTRAVMLTTESLGRPETAAGRKTLPGMAAREVLDVITAVMVVFSWHMLADLRCFSSAEAEGQTLGQ